MRSRPARAAAVAAGLVAGLVAALTSATAAYAHVEVRAEPAVAGASNAVVTLSAEAESSSAGIASLRVVLPDGITAADVSLTDGQTGWTLTPAADGYTVAGPALPAGQDAVHSVTVLRLPDTTRLVFKVLVNYSDGTVDRWIEEPTATNPDPENPAAVLELQPAPRPTGPTTTPATPSLVTAGPTATTAVAAVPPAGGSGGGSWVWWLAGAGLLVVAVLVVVMLVRRRAEPAEAGS